MSAPLLSKEAGEILARLFHQRIGVLQAQMLLNQLVTSGKYIPSQDEALTAAQVNAAFLDAHRLNTLLQALVDENVTFIQALESQTNGAKFFNISAAKQAIDRAEAACTPQDELPSSLEFQALLPTTQTTGNSSI